MNERIFLIGFMGAGKSFWGEWLGGQLDIPFLDLDEYIYKMEGKSISDIFRIEGESYFRKIERDGLHQIAKFKQFVLACGGGTPCYYNNMEFMNQNGITIWLNPSIETLIQRVKSKNNKRPLISEMDEKQMKVYFKKKIKERQNFYQMAQFRIDFEFQSGETLLNLIHNE